MLQSLASYPLVQCVVAAAQFASGEVAFYDTFAELMAADAEGGSTSPLRIDYDTLEHFRIVRAQRVMRLTVPRLVVRRWAEQNGFASQLEVDEDGAERESDGQRQQQQQRSPSSTAVLLLQLQSDDMANFLQCIAPVVAASRRTRSVSRISVTEPLPLYCAVVDPAPDVTLDSRAASCTATLTQNIDAAVGEEDGGEVESQEPHLEKTSAPAALWGDTKALLGADASSASERGEAENDEPLESAEGMRRQHEPASRTAAHDTMESAEEELAGLLEEAEFSQLYTAAGDRGGLAAAQPLKRPSSFLPSAAVKEKTVGRGFGKNTTAASACPSLVSSSAAARRGRTALDAEKGGVAADSSLTSEKAAEGQTTRSRTNRLIIAHLCTSEKASSPASVCMDAATAKGRRSSVVEAAAETVATVTRQSDRLQRDRVVGRLRLAEFSLETPTRIQKVAEAEVKVPRKVREDDDGDEAAHGSTGVSSHQKLKGRATVAHKSPAQSPALTRLGDLLSCKTAQPAGADALISVRERAAKDSVAASTAVLPQPTASLQASSGRPALPSTRPTAAKAPPVQVDMQRDVKAYLLDLFPPASAGATASKATRRTARKSTTTAAARPAVASRQRGKAKAAVTTPAEQRPAADPPTDKQKGQHLVVSDPSALAAAASGNTTALHLPHTTRKRERSPSCPAGEAKAKRSSTAHGTSQTAAHLRQVGQGEAEQHSSSSPQRKGEVVEAHREGRASALTKTAQRFSVKDADACFQAPPLPAIPRSAAPEQSVTKADNQNAVGGIAVEGVDGDDGGAATAQRSPSAAAAAAATVAAVRAPRSTAAAAKSQAEKLNSSVVADPTHVATEQVVDRSAPGCIIRHFSESVNTSSSSSSCPQTPLFYRSDSRKERTRRLMRYMNVVSQSLATVHEAHDALRGLLLTMLSDSQL